MQEPPSGLLCPLSPARVGWAPALVILLLGVATLQAQTIIDDFNSGNDTNWTHYALPLYGTPSYTFPPDGSGGYAYRIQAPPTGTDPFGLRNARAGSLRMQASYTNRFSVGVDLLTANTTWNHYVGMVFKLRNIGLGTTAGYAALCSANMIYLESITNEASTFIGGQLVPFDPTHSYRLVVSTHDGSTYLLTAFDKLQPNSPLASAISSDHTYDGVAGPCGLMVVQEDYPSAIEGGDATFDKYLSTAPAAGAMPATVTDLSPPPAGKATALYPTVAVGILNRDTTVNTNSILLWLDGVQIPYGSLTIDANYVYKPQNAGVNQTYFNGATVTYSNGIQYAWGSQHTNVVAFMDSTSTWQTNTWTWTTAYPYLFASNSLPIGSLSLPGFNTRLVVSYKPGSLAYANIANGGLHNSLVSAQAVLASPSQYSSNLSSTNIAQLVAWDLTPPDIYGAVSNFPGLGTNQNSFALQAAAYLQLTAGLHRFYVDSDDCVAIYSGTNVTDTSTVLFARYDGTVYHESFDFLVAADGLYPFNIIYEQGTGPAYLVLHSVNLADNSQTLLNAPGGIRAFYWPAPPAITSQPQSLTNLVGGTASFNVTATGTAPMSYQWQFKGTNLTDNTRISGASSTCLTISNVLMSDAGNYQVVLTNACGGTNSVVATLTAVEITQQPANLTVCAGTPAIFTVGLSSAAGLTYQWQVSQDGGSSFTNVSATATNASYTNESPQLPDNGNEYIAIVTVGGALATSAPPAVLTVNAAATASAGGNQTIFTGSSTAGLGGVIGGTATGGTWSSSGTGAFVPDATTLNAAYTPSQADITAGSVRLTLTSSGQLPPCSAAATAQVVVTIYSPATITDQPTNLTTCAGSPAIFSVAAMGGGLTYQWQVSRDGGITFTNISDMATNATFTNLVTQLTDNSNQFLVVVTGKIGSPETSAPPAVLSAVAAATAHAGGNQTICSGSSTAGLTGVIGGGATNGLWSSLGTGAFLPDATTLNATYSPSAGDIAAGTVTLTLTSTDQGAPCSAATAQVVVTLRAAATASAGGNQTICSGSSTAGLGGGIGGGATGGLWTAVPGGGTFAPNPTALNATYSPSAADIAAGGVILTLTTTGQAAACRAASAQVNIYINQTPRVPTTQGATICGAGVAYLQVIGLQQGVSYAWYSDVTLTNQVGNDSTLITPLLTNTTTYYVVPTLGAPYHTCVGPASPATATVIAPATVSMGPQQSVYITNGLPQPGLAIRAWNQAGAPGCTSGGAMDGAQFDAVNPNPAPTASTAQGTIGYATQSINMPNGGPHEHFTATDQCGVAPAGPFPTGYSTNYCVEYRGLIYIAVSNRYTFATASDDGSALWIDPGTDNPTYSHAQVQNNYSQPLTARYSSAIAMSAGFHAIIIRYNQGDGGNALRVYYDPAGGQNWGVMPGSLFYHSVSNGPPQPGLTVRAWNQSMAPGCTCAGAMDGGQFDAASPSPAPTASTALGTVGYATQSVNMPNVGPQEHFTTTDQCGVAAPGPYPTGYTTNYCVEYRGLIYLAVSNRYTFATASDDGSALWIDPGTDNPTYSQAQVQNNNCQVLTTKGSSPIALAAGYHVIIIRYNQRASNNALQVFYDPTGGQHWVVIPGSLFYHTLATPTVVLAGSYGGGATGVAWSGAGGFLPNNTAINATYQLTASEVAAGSATVTLTTTGEPVPCVNASATMTIPVYVGPTIPVPPANQTVVAGSSVTFAVTAVGTPQLGYQWLFAGTNVAGATAASYSISEVRASDAGNYDVVVTNAYGSVTSILASLTVVKAPATVTLANLFQFFEGAAVSTTTAPPGLTVDLTYNGSVNVPTNAGNYTVIGTINDPNYQGSTTNTLVIVGSQTWKQTSAPNGWWASVAASADGTSMVAAAGNWFSGGPGQIYASTNCGATWTPTGAPEAYWAAIASSASGTRLVAAQAAYLNGNPGAIYTSTNSGATWTLTSAPEAYWASVASSADGTKLVAAQVADADGNPGAIYTSTNSGATWSPAVVPSDWWASVASSAEGTNLVAAAGNVATGSPGLVYVSTNSGATWTPASAPDVYWASVASSAEGTKLVAAQAADANGHPGAIYASTNSGATWNPTDAPIGSWASAASSANGTKLVAAAGNAAAGSPGLIYTSTDSGAVWTTTSSPIDQWAAVASSTDGTRLVAAAAYGGIYIWASAPRPCSLSSSINGGQLNLQLTGTPNHPYILELATNLTPLINWQPVVTNSADANGNWIFVVTNRTAVPASYYRAVRQ
ncbi:MAG: immunoglobulin domain-containing protein [Verrucomicrobiota bacterium]